MIDINELRKVAQDDNSIILTDHVYQRIYEREVTPADLINVLMNGEIIEQYPDDYPHPSCLILGHSLDQRPLHIVCATGKTKYAQKPAIWMITVYEPDEDKWDNDFKTRKE